MRALALALLLSSSLPLPVLAQSEVPAVIFLQYLNQNAPQVMCSDASLNQCMGFNQQDCVSQVRTAAEACQTTLMQSWPGQFAETRENALRYSSEYRQCIYRQWQRTGAVEPLRMNLCLNGN